MSLEKDITQIKKLVEEKPIFKAASKQELMQRKKICPFCGNGILKLAPKDSGVDIYCPKCGFAGDSYDSQMDLLREAQPVFKPASDQNIQAREEQKRTELEKKFGSVEKVAEGGQPVKFGPGEYFLGDICYALDDDIYDKVWGSMFNYDDGAYKVRGYVFAVSSTAYGDGAYSGTDGVTYGVDAGVIGIVPKELSQLDSHGGRWIKVKTSLTFQAGDGIFNIYIDRGEIVEIDTKNDPNREEDETTDESKMTEEKDVVFKAASKKQINKRPKPEAFFTYHVFSWDDENNHTDQWIDSLPEAEEYAKRLVRAGWSRVRIEEIAEDDDDGEIIWFGGDEDSPDYSLKDAETDIKAGASVDASLIEANNPIFKAASKSQLAKRKEEYDRGYAQRLKATETMNKMLEMQPENAEPFLSIYFDVIEDDERKDVFREFVDVLYKEDKIKLTDLYNKYIRNAPEGEANEIEFCEKAAERIAAAGLFVYNGDTYFEVYTPEEIANAIIYESNEPVFKAATPQQIAARPQQAPRKRKLEDLYRIAGEIGLPIDKTQLFVSYITRRWPDVDYGYAKEWAKRFLKGDEWVASDLSGRSLLRSLKPDLYPDDLYGSMRRSTFESENPVFKPATPEQIAARPNLGYKIPYEEWYEVYEDKGDDGGTETWHSTQTYRHALEIKSVLEKDWPEKEFGIDKWRRAPNGDSEPIDDWRPEQEPVVEAKPIFKAASQEQIASRPKPAPAYKIVEYPTGRIVKVSKSALEVLKLSALVSWDEEGEGQWQFDDSDWEKIDQYLRGNPIVEAKPIFKAATPEQISKRHQLRPLSDDRDDYLGRKIQDLNDEDVNHISDLELNSCDRCGRIEFSNDLCWVEFYYEGQEIPKKMRKYTAICQNCQSDLLSDEVNEAKPIFKAATAANLRARNSRPEKIPPPGGFEYRFLRFIEDPDPEAKTWKLTGMGSYIDMDDSEIWFHTDDDIDISIYIDTNSAINDHLNRDDALTKECQEHFEKSGAIGFAGKISEWVKSRGWEVIESANTSSFDNSYFLGSVFEYTTFEDAYDDRGIVIMMYLGGDVRGNYAYPIVYFGDVEDFFSSHWISDYKEDTANFFGYQYYDDLIWDIKKYRGSIPEGENRPHEVESPGQIRWKMNNENPAETYTEAKEVVSVK
jgi:ribosomal protein S27AE